MKNSGSADLALMGGSIPSWLFERMTKLSLPVVEAIILDYGTKGFLSRLSDPFWFQSFGAVIGMDWNSSGVTTAVLNALKQSLNPHSRSLGLYVCGGKGKESLATPAELKKVGDKTGKDGNLLARYSKLSAKVDNTAVQDGYNLYIHGFVVSADGDWSVIQQGMKPENGSARRYHWHSEGITSFVKEPHAAVCGDHQGEILNMVDAKAEPAQNGILEITNQKPVHILNELQHISLPKYKGIKSGDIDLKRLGSILWTAQEIETSNFEDLLLLKGLGPRTLQSLALVSEVIHGTQSRFSDPARFAFAHGSKGGNPFSVPTKVYDETICTLKTAVEQAKIDRSDKLKAIEKLSKLARKAEQNFEPGDGVEELIQKEKKESWKYGGRTVKGFEKKPKNGQLGFFE